MWQRGDGTRYTAGQLVEAIGRARGEGRFFLVDALCYFPGREREDGLAHILDEADLRPDERHMVRATLAQLRPGRYLRPLIAEGFRSRSINVQQMTVAVLPSLIGDGLEADVADEVERWLRHRLKNPGRANTWAGWEVPGIALSLLPSRGPATVWGLLDELSPRLQPEERERWHRLRQTPDDAARVEGLRSWHQEDGSLEDDRSDLDPTALVYVDRTMKRLGFTPANPESETYDDDPDDEARKYEITLDVRQPDL